MEKEENGRKAKKRANLSYTLPRQARQRLEEIVKNLPKELAANLSNVQEAITLTYLITNPKPRDQIITERLLKMLRREELKLSTED